jgi:hypothetical protein
MLSFDLLKPEVDPILFEKLLIVSKVRLYTTVFSKLYPSLSHEFCFYTLTDSHLLVVENINLFCQLLNIALINLKDVNKVLERRIRKKTF